MKVNDPNLTSVGTSGASRAPETARTNPGGRAADFAGAKASPNDDVHLSELVRALRSLAADSPDRQAKIEALTRAYAGGTYKVDAPATAEAIIQDAIKG